MRKGQVIAALITGGAVVIAAFIGIYPSIRNAKEGTIAGIVVDQENHGVGQAAIVIAGRAEKYLTDDTGNFRFEVGGKAPKDLRIHVSKIGFQTLDDTITVPSENLVLQLHK